LGGDEFVMLLEHIKSPDDAVAIAEKIRRAVNQHVHIDGSDLRMFPSIGIAFYPDHGSNVEQLLKHADKEMYSAKKRKILAPD
jgi:diguanylate cyclase (GGDEF)-like protein